MVFSSLIFIFVFLPIILFFYYGPLQKQPHRNFFLLLVSIFFYAWGEPTYFVLIILSIFANFKVGQLMDASYAEETEKKQGSGKKNSPPPGPVTTQTEESRRRQTELLWAGIFFNLIFLFFFKYEGFFVTNANRLLQYDFFTSLNLPLPIGISFFTFQAISYLVDVYRRTVPVQKSAVALGLYISFFPQLVAGPIVRYNTIAQQIETRTTTYDQFNLGVKRFILGLGKKIVFANQFALVATESFISPSPSVTFAWLGAFAYTLQIYYDFSGYSDMAIGLGKMFGFDFQENFRYPYIAKTVTDFWRRWHISLGSWFKDYVYIPLGGSKVKKPRLIFNLLVVWLLTGIWHGAAWNFIAWGLGYFLLLTFEKLTPLQKFLKCKPFAWIYQLFTFVVVMFGWVIFAEPSLSSGLEHIGFMLDIVGNHTLYLYDDAQRFLQQYGVLLSLATLFATPIVPIAFSLLHKKITPVLAEQLTFCRYLYAYGSSLLYLALFFISLSYLVIDAHNPFIYFNF